jgi:Na+-transporting methylmalonyl-CoA/oxaloacetate decarboxylase gamma subunit
VSFGILWFPLVWGLVDSWYSFGFLCFLLVLFRFQGKTKRKENPRKTQTNQGKFKEAINSQNASIMPVTKEVARHFDRCQKPN